MNLDQAKEFLISNIRYDIKNHYNMLALLSIDEIKKSIEQEIAYRVYSGEWK